MTNKYDKVTDVDQSFCLFHCWVALKHFPLVLSKCHNQIVPLFTQFSLYTGQQLL